jgi:hypothetical protein
VTGLAGDYFLKNSSGVSTFWGNLWPNVEQVNFNLIITYIILSEVQPLPSFSKAHTLMLFVRCSAHSMLRKSCSSEWKLL